MTAAELGFGLAYSASAILAFAAGLRSRAEGSREFWVWLLIALVLAVFAALRMTAGHEAIVGHLRDNARQDGWYDQRRVLQRWVLNLLVGAALVLILLLAVAIRHLRPAVLTAGVGVLLLGLFSAARGMSMHRLDDLLTRQIGPLNLAQIEETILLLFTAGAAATAAATAKGAATVSSRASGRSRTRNA